ncbi:hypothetical protein [Aestuariivivens marinum]|uniref:hypothetical protein n=1 Tax=Aestuariivivens marinum TaxID=2913555 RepID=UPI001F589ACA|nr:hypothetical protein [Aestuariivivens marinum]
MHSNIEHLSIDKEEVKTKRKTQYNGIVFEFTQYALYIYFKPHYFYNNNKHNANDFSVLDCVNTIQKFIKTFDISPIYYQVINIEYALNIILPQHLIDVRELLIYLIFHGKNRFYTLKNYQYCRFSSSIKECGKSNVYKIIKAYAKGVQFPEFTDKNTFRFEVKSNRKAYINNLGIVTLDNLLNPNIYSVLALNIQKEFDEVLIIDEITKPEISNAKRKNHLKRLNPLHWEKLLNKSQNVFRQNIKTYYKDLNTCESHLKKELKKLIFSKILELKMCAYLTIYKD